jgi:hypothetical protein
MEPEMAEADAESEAQETGLVVAPLTPEARAAALRGAARPHPRAGASLSSTAL